MSARAAVALSRSFTGRVQFPGKDLVIPVDMARESAQSVADYILG
jgi:hypothetical protein